MKQSWLGIIAAVALTAVPGLVLRAQAPQGQATAAAPSTELPGKVYLSGENPGITLRERDGGPALTQVSYWRVHWSPVGAGHVCYVTTGDGTKPGDLRIAIHDNQKLYELITDEMFKTFNESYRTRPFTPVSGGTFTMSGDSISERTETCKGGRHNVSLKWRKLQEPVLIHINPGRPANPFGLTFLRIPAQDAEVTINGKKQPGGVFPQAGGTGGAILAFGETWRK